MPKAKNDWMTTPKIPRLEAPTSSLPIEVLLLVYKRCKSSDLLLLKKSQIWQIMRKND